MTGFRIFLAFVALCWVLPSTARAEFDLALSARIATSPLLSDPLGSTSFLRDDDPETVFSPQTAEPFSLILDLAPADEKAGIEPGRIELDWKGDWKGDIAIYAGPDRYTLYRLESVHVDSTAEPLVVTPENAPSGVRFFRLDFPRGGFSLKRLSIFASGETALGTQPTLSLEQTDDTIHLAWPKVSGAHHFEIERSGSDQTAQWTTRYLATMDRPVGNGPFAYRVRAIDASGNPGSWSQAVELSDYQATIENAPALRGIIETGRGVEWSQSRRLKMMRTAGNWGLAQYLFIPKSWSSLHDNWRSPHTEVERTMLAELSQTAKAFGLSFLYGISPNDITSNEADDISALTAKIESALDLGATGIVLILDSTSADASGELGASHAALITSISASIQAASEEALFLVVPLVSTGAPAALSNSELAYLDALNVDDTSIPLAWRGRELGADEIGVEDISGIAAHTGHPVWLWDRHPADRTYGRHASSITGRPLDTISETEGLLFEPGETALLSLAQVSSLAELLVGKQESDRVSAETLGAWLDPDIDATGWHVLLSALDGTGDALSEITDHFDADIQAIETGLFSSGKAESANDLLSLLAMSDHFRFQSKDADFSEEIYGALSRIATASLGVVSAYRLAMASLYGRRDAYYTDEPILQDGQSALENGLTIPLDKAMSAIFNLLSEEIPTSDSAPEGILIPLITSSASTVRSGLSINIGSGVGQPSNVNWMLSASNPFTFQPESELASVSAAIDNNGLIALSPAEDSSNLSYWLKVVSEDNGLSQLAMFPIHVLPPLREERTVSLPTNTKLETAGEVAYLRAGDVIIPDISTTQYAKVSLAGKWQAMRMGLDQRLTVADRSSNTIALLSAESGGAIYTDFNDDDWNTIALPGPINRLPVVGDSSGPEHYSGGIWLRREAAVPKDGRVIRLVCDGCGPIIDVWADGVYLGHHEGITTPGYFLLPEDLVARDSVLLALRIDQPDPIAFPGIMTGLPGSDAFAYAGVLRGIYWEHLPTEQKAAFARVIAEPQASSGQFRVSVIVENFSGESLPAEVTLSAFLTDNKAESYWSGSNIGAVATESAELAGTTSLEMTIPIEAPAGGILDATVIAGLEWTPEAPRLYVLRVTLKDSDGNRLDRYTLPLAFRTVGADEKGRMTFNTKIGFFPGVAYRDQNALTGPAQSWTDRRFDLARLRHAGALFLHTSDVPAQADTYALADRIGLASFATLPISGMTADSVLAAHDRGALLQTWREMIFSQAGHPSIVGWEVGHLPPDGISDVLDELLADWRDNYNDKRMSIVTISDTSDPLSIAMLAADADIVGVSLSAGAATAEVVSSTLASLRDAVGSKPIFVTRAGRDSGSSGTESAAQRNAAEILWEGTLPWTQSKAGGAVNNDGFVAGFTWWPVYDHYSANGVNTGGLYDISRSGLRPAGQYIFDKYYGFVSGRDGDSVYIAPPNTPDSGCRGIPFSLSFGLVFLILSVLAIRRMNRKVV